MEELKSSKNRLPRGIAYVPKQAVYAKRGWEYRLAAFKQPRKMAMGETKWPVSRYTLLLQRRWADFEDEYLLPTFVNTVLNNYTN